jgi:protein-disulfide isomerase
VQGTPALFVDGQMVTNSQNPQYLPTYEDIKAAIEAALATAP